MKILQYLYTLIALLIVLWEDLVYKPLARLGDRLAQLEFFARLQFTIRSLPPYAALLVFLVPIILLFPIKVMALAVIATGHALIGALIFVAAKILGALLLTRIFMLTEASIRQIAFIDKVLTKFFYYKNVLKLYFINSRAYKGYIEFKVKIKNYIGLKR